MPPRAVGVIRVPVAADGHERSTVASPVPREACSASGTVPSARSTCVSLAVPIPGIQTQEPAGLVQLERSASGGHRPL